MENNKENGQDNPAFQGSSENLGVENRNGNASLPPSNKRSEKPQPERAQWSNGLQFLMSCIAMSVGLGNIWRFPFTAYENGGGAFLIPYIIVLIVIGRPFYYMEMCLGQFTSRGGVKAFGALGSGFKGIAYTQLLGTAAVATYYCSIMAVAAYYFINSFTGTLPWSYCWEEWAEILEKRGQTCIAASSKEVGSNNSISSSELFYTLEVLREINSIDDGIGTPDWRLTLCLLFSWAACFVVARSGVRSSGHFSYFLALFPYVIIGILLIRGVTLPGSAKGMLYFVTPQWDKLLTADVWYAAVTQCFFSLSVGFGTIIMYSSYNNFDHNVNRDALVVTTVDTLTSLLSGTTIFAILGNLAHELGVDVDQVISSGGSGLAFISYPDAIAKFDWAPWLFAILFFLMLWILGVGSLIALHSAVNTAITDAFPKLKDWYVSGGTAIAMFLIGLVYVTPGGQFILVLVDFFAGTFIIFMAAILEITAVAIVYGVQNFCLDVEFMTKGNVNIYWRWTWGFITPVMMYIIFIYFVATIEELTYGSFTFPLSALISGWMIVAVGAALLILFPIRYIIKNRELGCFQMVTETFRARKWKPDDPKRAYKWMEFRKRKEEEKQLKGRSWCRNTLAFYLGR